MHQFNSLDCYQEADWVEGLTCIAALPDVLHSCVASCSPNRMPGDFGDTSALPTIVRRSNANC